MEPSEVWPAIDPALHDLGILCSETNSDHPMDINEKSRMVINDWNTNVNAGRCHDRYLLPCQAWNRPASLVDSAVNSSQNDSWRNHCHPPDGENTENSYSVKGGKLVKITESKTNVEHGNASLYPPCLSEVVRGSEGLRVLKMNSQYMTGVSISTARASGFSFQPGNSYTKPINAHSTPKLGPSVPSVRLHHVRPYEIPWRREDRMRSKSENAEKEAAMKLMDRIDVSLNFPVIDNFSTSSAERCRRSLLKSRSLENVRLAEDETSQLPVHEMDSMSNRIQHLHVNE
ncbi:uncharacterized protein LOC124171314 [Ischnura elegans]|uniref:uncharacterized protein LOC124171314 n=1 Tax=Ischnura elegans TaxID=197161 RepID=UPI001ED89E6E|nr:uncharacterized protein LOC124171314 [Ischnura elegans]XP_046406417.1 uncharacterized protein LOC124171314 [Ischnura elegans]XP_046406418.1 uncharacterized protein LOC124171314 [Ischnura elegans]XP_046406419.1 uncharacterized protein LOC124171314 [Ischnura elegans]